MKKEPQITPHTHIKDTVSELHHIYLASDRADELRHLPKEKYNAEAVRIAGQLGVIALYEANLDATVLDPESSSYSVPKTNNQLAINKTIEELSSEESYNNVMSLCAFAIVWQNRLDQLKTIYNQTHKLSSSQHSEYEVLRNRMCSYNKLVKEFINNFGNNSQFSLRATISALAESAKLHNPSLKMEVIFNTLRSIIDGARYELLFETQIQNSDYKIIPTTIQQDLDGIDYVLDDGSSLIKVDIKSSLTGVHGAEKLHNNPNLPAYKHRYSKKSGTIFVLWPLVTKRQFGDRLAPPIIPAADKQVLDLLNNVA